MKLLHRIMLMLQMEDDLIGQQQENKEKIAKIVAEIEAQAKSGFNILNYIKATFQGKLMPVLPLN